MYNRDKIIETLHDIKKESETIDPYIIIAQPRRSKKETAAQTFSGFGLNHVDVMGNSFAVIDIEGELVDVARNYLIDRCLNDSTAKYMFFIGEDTVIPYDAFEILHKTAEQNPGSIVCGVYYIKCSHAMISVKENNYIKVPNVDPGQVFEAWQTGMDCMLIPLDPLREIRKKEPEIPWCCIANEIVDGLPFIGEDNFFMHRMRKHGIKVLVDTNVQCLHMDLATGKYTAHPSVNLDKYYTNIKPAGVLTLDDKKFIDHRWFARLPKGSNNLKQAPKRMLSGEDIPKLIEHVKNPVGLEIGVGDGTTSQYLLQSIPTLKLYTIDPFPDYIDWNDSKPDSAYNKRTYLSRTETFVDRLTHYYETSDDAVKHFEDESLDFVFIDGLHTYNQVKADIENYWPKVKKGGLFSGHDFATIQAVNKAVNEFSNKIGLEIKIAEQDIWYIKKPA